MPKLISIKPKFATTEDSVAYDTWLRSEVEASLADRRTGVPHEIVMAEMQAIIDRRKNLT